MATFSLETIEGYENFQLRIAELDKNQNEKRVVILFCGDNKEDGTNWCPDCRELDELLVCLEPELKGTSAHFIRVKVGQRDAWKSSQCSFRTDPVLQLSSIPTIMIWNTKEKEFDLKTLLTREILLSKFGV